LAHAANSPRNKLDGRAKGINPMEVKEKLDRGDDFILLDVRTLKEFQKYACPTRTQYSFSWAY